MRPSPVGAAAPARWRSQLPTGDGQPATGSCQTARDGMMMSEGPVALRPEPLARAAIRGAGYGGYDPVSPGGRPPAFSRFAAPGAGQSSAPANYRRSPGYRGRDP